MSDAKVQKEHDSHIESQILTNADVPLNVNGRDLRAKAPTDRDFTELNVWVKAQYLKTVKEAIDLLPPADQSGFRSDAMKTVIQVNWGNELGLPFINTPQGITKIAWMMLRANHSELTEEWILNSMKQAHNVKAVSEVFEHFNEFVGAVESSNTGGSGKN